MNAETWISSALEAARTALRRSGHASAEPVWRDGRFDLAHPWASFAIADSNDVLWVAQVHGTAPHGAFVVETSLGDMGVWRHPNDPALPGLAAAVTPGRLSMLSSVASHVDPRLVEVVTLQPLQRATVRIGSPNDAVYVKIVPPWRVERVADNHRRARDARVPAPEILDVDGRNGLIVFAELPGATLAEHLELGRPVPTSDAIWSLVELFMSSVATHGDLHDRQILLDDDGAIVGVVDLDDAGERELVEDVGSLVAHVLMRAITHPDQRDRIETYGRGLRETFARHVDVESLDREILRTQHRLQAARTNDE